MCATSETMGRLLLTRDQVAEVLGVPVETVDGLHRAKLLRAVRVGKHNRWRPEAVQSYVDGLEPVE